MERNAKKTLIVLLIVFLCLQPQISIFIKFKDPQNGFITYFGGSADDASWDMKLDSEENIVIVGSTQSVDFPTKNALQNDLKGTEDIFIAKFSNNGELIFSTYFGGNLSESSFSFDLDSEDNIWISGITSSTDFPLSNEMSSVLNGSQDFFISKIADDGQMLLFSTYFGGNGTDSSSKLICDSEDNIIFGCVTSSDLPLNSLSQRDFSGGESDVYISKINTQDFSIVFSTYLGGEYSDVGFPTDTDSENNILVTGYTYSSDFPTKNALYPEISGNSDAFITKLSSIGGNILFSTFFGGFHTEYGLTGLFDKYSNILFGGVTESYDIPILNAYQEEHYGHWEDLFIAKLNSDGQKLLFSTYLGGDDKEFNGALNLDKRGNIYISGRSASEDFPLRKAEKTTIDGQTDATITILSPNGKRNLFSTYFGGNLEEWFVDIVVGSEDYVICLGITQSTNIETINAFQSNLNGNVDLIICKSYRNVVNYILYIPNSIIYSVSIGTIAIISIGTFSIFNRKRTRKVRNK